MRPKLTGRTARHWYFCTSLSKFYLIHTIKKYIKIIPQTRKHKDTAHRNKDIIEGFPNFQKILRCIYCKSYQKMSTINECPTIFCGCQSIHSPCNSDPSWTTQQQLELSYKVYLYVLFMFVTVMLCIKLGLQWFIYKDYYPLKEKSPILTIVMAFSICMQMLLYPFIYTLNYFTFIFVVPGVRSYFRAVQVGLEFSVYCIYLLRSTRISYAHEIDKSRRKSLAFRIFEREYLLAIIVMAVCILRSIIVILDPCNKQQGAFCTNFSFGFELASVHGQNASEEFFMIRTLVSSFFWQSLLIFCIWQHRNVNYRYSMTAEIGLIVGCIQITYIFHIFTIYSSIYNNENSIMLYLCSISAIYPMTQFPKLVNLLTAFIISIVVPLFQRKVYHVLLPTGPHYGFVKTMRNFLMEKEFLRVFSAYLKYLDRVEGVDCYEKLLQFWQQMILLKISHGKQSQSSKLQSIISIVEDIEQSSLLQQHVQLINSVKGTITGLQDSSIEQQEKKKEVTTSFESMRRQKYRNSINDHVDELEEIALEKLNGIYQEKYWLTQSYHVLREIMDEYKKVNLNLIMLNMALIVDNENEFT